MEIADSMLFLICCIGIFVGGIFGVYLPLYLFHFRKKSSEIKFGKKFWYGLIVTVWVIFFGIVCETVFTMSLSFSYEFWWCIIIMTIFCLFLTILSVYYIHTLSLVGKGEGFA